jgi:hypothetical protein
VFLQDRGLAHGPPLPVDVSVPEREFCLAVQSTGLFTAKVLPKARSLVWGDKQKHVGEDEEADPTKVDVFQWRSRAAELLSEIDGAIASSQNLDDLFKHGDADESGLIDVEELLRLEGLIRDGSWRGVVADIERNRRLRREWADAHDGEEMPVAVDVDGNVYVGNESPMETVAAFGERTHLFRAMEEWWKPAGGNWIGTMTNHDLNPRPFLNATVEQHKYNDAQRLLNEALRRFDAEVDALKGVEGGEFTTLPKDTCTLYDMRELILDDGIFGRPCSYELNYKAVDCLKLAKGVEPGKGSDIVERVDCRKLVDSLLNVKVTFYSYVL